MTQNQTKEMDSFRRQLPPSQYSNLTRSDTAAYGPAHLLHSRSYHMQQLMRVHGRLRCRTESAKHMRGGNLCCISLTQRATTIPTQQQLDYSTSTTTAAAVLCP
ncbi:hypothetical protein BASA61_001990 [Batrachochytrium salamandrivorans]|nr:hypothetical protein BASA61_001990 [Batrachochytrium salamandrivorans]